jgi:hypothetical protein
MYQDCYSLPVMNYIDIISLGDIKKYKRTWFPVTVKCYLQAGEKIREHASRISKNTKIKVLERLSSEIERLKEKHSNLLLIGQVLELKESEICLLKLKEYGYNATDREMALKSVISALKNISINLQLLEKEYNDKKVDDGEKKATTKDEFIAQKQLLNKQGFRITDKSSTADYLTSIGIIADEVKRMESKMNKK